MDHVVYVDHKAKELDSILDRTKTMIVRGAAGRKVPYGRVFEGDILYFIENNADGKIKAKAAVSNVFNSEKMEKDQSISLIAENQPKLKLSSAQTKRWSGKRYLVLIEIDNVSSLEPFSIDKSNFSNMDDWLMVEDINKVKT